MATKYKCALITPLLNSHEIARTTYESLAHQLNGDLCWFVKNSGVDSANALEFMKKHEHIVYVERPDSSLYEAVNQALAMVDAEYYVVLGAGDKLSEHAGALLLGCIEQFKGQDAFFFAAKRFPKELTVLPRPDLLPAFMSTSHAGAVLKVENSREIGGYDVRYKIAADYDHLCRYTKTFPVCAINNFVLTHYLGGGISERRLLEGYIECCLVRLRVCGTPQERETLTMQRDLSSFVHCAFVP